MGAPPRRGVCHPLTLPFHRRLPALPASFALMQTPCRHMNRGLSFSNSTIRWENTRHRHPRPTSIPSSVVRPREALHGPISAINSSLSQKTLISTTTLFLHLLSLPSHRRLYTHFTFDISPSSPSVQSPITSSSVRHEDVSSTRGDRLAETRIPWRP